MNTIVLSHKKIASIFFLHCLMSHPDINAYSEMFRSWKKGTKKTENNRYYFHFFNGNHKEYIEWLFNDEKIVTLLLRYYHYNNKIEKVIFEKNIPIIHHSRRNKLKHAISIYLPGQERGIVRATPDQIVEKIKLLKNWEKKFDSIYENHNVLKIYYEDMIGEDEEDRTYLDREMSNKICDFVQVPRFHMFAMKQKQTKKQKSENVWDYIQEKDRKEMRKLLKKNNMEYYLEQI